MSSELVHAMPLPRIEPAAPRVLIADDDPIFRSLVRSRLQRIAGDIVEAEDGTSAWGHIRAVDFQLVVVDLDMPGFDGFGLIQVLRGHPRTRHIPIVVCTSHSTLDAMRKAVSAGASSYLTKPVNWSMFEPHVEQLLHATMAAVAAERAAAGLAGQLTGVEAQLRTLQTHADALLASIAGAEEAARLAGSGAEILAALETVTAAAARLAEHVALAADDAGRRPASVMPATAA